MTVEQLIEKLKALPPGARVVISDADTQWDLEPFVDLGRCDLGECDPNTVYLWSTYGDVIPQPAPEPAPRNGPRPMTLEEVAKARANRAALWMDGVKW